MHYLYQRRFIRPRKRRAGMRQFLLLFRPFQVHHLHLAALIRIRRAIVTVQIETFFAARSPQGASGKGEASPLPHALCGIGFSLMIIHDVPNLSRSMLKRCA